MLSALILIHNTNNSMEGGRETHPLRLEGSFICVLLMVVMIMPMEVEGDCTSFPIPPDQPCGMTGANTTNWVELALGPFTSGTCCHLVGTTSGLVTDACYRNIIVCDQAYYVPRETKVITGHSPLVYPTPPNWTDSVCTWILQVRARLEGQFVITEPGQLRMDVIAFVPSCYNTPSAPILHSPIADVLVCEVDKC